MDTILTLEMVLDADGNDVILRHVRYRCIAAVINADILTDNTSEYHRDLIERLERGEKIIIDITERSR